MSSGFGVQVAAFQDTFRRVKLLVLDVDGVLTDGRLYYGPQGESLKSFHVRDGHGIKQVQAAGIDVAIISGRKSAAVLRRAKGLGVKHVFQGVDDKLAALRKLAKSLRVKLEDCACIGDDTPDAPILNACGLGVAVADAHADALAAADLETARPGGHGAVREVCDWLIAARAGG
ncbi:MAG TPA: HAD-IIIA family hydrolase [Steroidobacteraceae bacterium]|nr:HAD-IIIA family hydrolase [Steroidobacteraceae bacterium]